ncbi:MAG: hypothetical protein JO245_13480 [Pseudolabrys sp.]|nr:hypothetical protein [Pseudolabrys sp.]
MRMFSNLSPNLKFALKAGALIIGVLVWGLGLADQLDDPIQTAKYVGISALMVAATALV